MNIYVHIFLWSYIFLFNSYLWVDLLSHAINLYLTSLEAAKLFSTFYQNGIFVTIHELPWIHHHPKSMGYIRAHS